MVAPIIGFAIQQLGLRAIPVLLRTGQTAMRYFVTSPGNKGKATTELAKRVLGKNNVVDDIGSLTAKVKNNPVSKIIDPKKLSTAERDALMQTTYRDSAKLLQKQPSFAVNSKLAKDIEAGFGGKFNKVFANRNFILGDRTAVTVTKTTEKLAKAPKQLPPPSAPVTSAAEIAKSRVSAGMGLPGRETLKTIPKVDRSKIIKLERAQRKIKTAAQGEGTGPVISEGLKGVGSAPKPAWWQGAIPSWLRVGGQPYKGAYPGAVSGERVLGATTGATFGGGLLFSGGSAIVDSMKDMGLEAEGPPQITDDQMMAQMVEEYKNSYQPTQTQNANVILPSAIE
jgi:hypothetical protein